MGGSGDLGTDVKATAPHGRRWVIQCTHRRHGATGTPAGTMQILNGTTRPVHHADIAVLITNSRITTPAHTFAHQQRLHLVDRRLLTTWATGTQPLWELLPATPPRTRRRHLP